MGAGHVTTKGAKIEHKSVWLCMSLYAPIPFGGNKSICLPNPCFVGDPIVGRHQHG